MKNLYDPEKKIPINERIEITKLECEFSEYQMMNDSYIKRLKEENELKEKNKLTPIKN